MLGVLQTLGGAGLFVPTDLGSTLKALYDAPNIQHTGSVTNGWLDSSGNGHNLAVVSGHAPGYVANNGGGQAAITCGSNNEWLADLTSATVRVRSFFAVISDLNTTGIACFCGAGRVYAQLNNANSFSIFTNHFGPDSLQTVGAGRHAIAIVMRSAVDMDFYLDGVKHTDTNGGSFYPDTPITICNENNSATFQPTNAHVEHMSLMDTPLADPDVANMFGYINRNYGV